MIDLRGWVAVVSFSCLSWKEMVVFWILSPLSSLQAYYFDRDDQALHNFAKFFRHQSHEEREHAEKLMKMQNQRGGRIFLQDVKVWTLVFYACFIYFFCPCVLTEALRVRLHGSGYHMAHVRRQTYELRDREGVIVPHCLSGRPAQPI